MGNRCWLAAGLAVLVAAAVLAGAGCQPAEEPEAAAPSQVDRTSPRATMASYVNAMVAARGGKVDYLDRALECLNLPDVPADEQVRAAEQLFSVLESATFHLTRFSADPDATSPEVVTLSIPTEPPAADDDTDEEDVPDLTEVPFEVRLTRYPGLGDIWLINTLTLEQAEELYPRVPTPEFTPEEAENLTWQLRHPRATMRTFLHGMNTLDDGGADLALAAMDYRGAGQDRETALQQAETLKFIIDRYETVYFLNIPNDPDIPQFVYLRRPEGNVVIAPVTTEEGDRLYKFTRSTLDDLNRLSAALMQEEVAAPEYVETAQRSLGVRLRLWVGQRAPYLLNTTLDVENWQWAGLLIIIFAGMIISRGAIAAVLLAIRRWFESSRYALRKDLEKSFARPLRLVIMAWVWWVGLYLLVLPADVAGYLFTAVKTFSALAAVWASFRLIDILAAFLAERAAKTANKFDDLLVPITSRALKVFAIVFGLVFIADVLEWNIGSVLAGLGLGGLAFALAAKDSLSNFFGSLTILADRPFHIGDWVVIGDVEGSVETVGMRSTRIRTFYNSLVTVPNADLITATIDNMGARRYRRCKTHLSIAYDTPPAKIEAFTEGIREIVRRHPYTRKDYYHVYLNQFAAASLDILVYVFFEVPDWATELRERHRFFLDVIRLARRLGVEFAFPTQTLYLRRDEAPGHENAPAEVASAFHIGREEARRIVEEGLPGGRVPPPVVIDPSASAPGQPGEMLEDEGEI